MNDSAPRIRLVIFDLAGTTIDFGSRAPAGVFVEVFAREGVTVADAEARVPMGMHKRDHIREMLRQPAVGARWAAAKGRPWTEEDVQRMYLAFEPLQLAVLDQHGDLIPGALDTVAALRARGIKVAATTGYNRAMTAVVRAAAARQGFVPDVVCCGEDVPAGRPAPWMAVSCAQALGVYPFWQAAKVGDTAVDIAEGRNAGMWSAGVIETGNAFGLSAAQLAALPDAERAQRRTAAAEAFQRDGAHASLVSVSDVPAWIAELDRRLAAGERPG